MKSREEARIAIQGERGAFSEEAVRKLSGRRRGGCAVRDFRCDVFCNTEWGCRLRFGAD